MEIPISLLALLVITLLVLPPVFFFRPLIVSISDRIAGKRPGAKELSELEKRVAMLEGEINEMRNKYDAIEESQEFSRKLLEDIHFNAGTRADEKTAEKLIAETEEKTG